jgi:predicted RNA-binding Zn-ribbon protein involved in translation (DUF1610 family)
MKQTIEAQALPDGTLAPMHEIHEVCMACGYDLTAEELQAEKCADCGAELEVKRSVTMHVTSIPMLGTANM